MDHSPSDDYSNSSSSLIDLPNPLVLNEDAIKGRTLLRINAMNDAEAPSTLSGALYPPPSLTAGLQPEKPTLPNTSTATTKEADDDVASVKADSEAETIIQSGREELSPQKKKTHIRHSLERTDGKDAAGRTSSDAASPDGWKARKRKRMDNGLRDADDLGSPVTTGFGGSRMQSPAPELKREKTEDSGVMSVLPAASLPHFETTEPVASDDTKQRGVSERSGRDHGAMSRTSNSKADGETNKFPSLRRVSSERSTSPVLRAHRRVTSESLHSPPRAQKKRRLPPPLLTERRRPVSEDRESLSSASGGSPRPFSRPRRLASSEMAVFSPARQTQNKKLRDQNGRTRLARACAAQEIEGAKLRYEERPDDLNVPDNAGNTPLQIAALEGCAEIVKFLVEAGCDINTRNIDRDTPLIDAVENGHVKVVKLLLQAGANPRVGNAKGDEPYDLVPSDNENCAKLRRILIDAKAQGSRRRKSDDFGQGPTSAKDSRSRGASTTSSRDSPPVHGNRTPPPPAGSVSRRRTVRSEATRNDLLWTKPTFENLRGFAAKGDMAGVATILNVLQKADTESLIAAAKGGHDEVLGILLGMGDPDPDPEPLRSASHRPGYNTPMLAAIGRGNVNVLKLLLDQRGFDPTRLDYRGRTYYEISQERKGDNWETEYDLLKNACDKAPKQQKSENRSPRKSREGHKIAKRPPPRDSESPAAAARKPLGRSPESHRQEESSKEAKARKEKKRNGNLPPFKERPSVKPPGHRDSVPKELKPPADQDDAHTDHRKPQSTPECRTHSDPAQASHGEEPIKRRRLIAGRKPSMVSSDSLSGREDAPKAAAQQSNDDSRVDTSGFMSKRPRNSMSPETHRIRSDRDEFHEQQLKRRRIQSEDEFTPSRGDNPKNKMDMSLPPKPRLQRRDSQSAKIEREKSISRLIKQERESANLNDPSPRDRRQKLDSEATPHALAEPAGNTKDKETREAEEKRVKAIAGAERETVEKAIAEEKAAKEAEEARVEAEKAKVAREKAEEEERKREEEEEDRKRKETELRRIQQEEEEKQKQMEQERLRQARIRREREDQEQKRRDALPRRLQTAANFIGSNDPRAKNHDWLQHFLPLMTASTNDIDSSCTVESEDERWVPNFFVAPLLATNDLQLSHCKFPCSLASIKELANQILDPSWEKRAVTITQKNNIWRVTRSMLAQQEEVNPLTVTAHDMSRRVLEIRPKYFGMEQIFWVKVRAFFHLSSTCLAYLILTIKYSSLILWI